MKQGIYLSSEIYDQTGFFLYVNFVRYCIGVLQGMTNDTTKPVIGQHQ